MQVFWLNNLKQFVWVQFMEAQELQKVQSLNFELYLRRNFTLGCHELQRNAT